MTLSGTNTYLVGGQGDRVVVVDPGPDDADHRAAVEAAMDRSDVGPVAVVVTHHHRDHAAATGWAAAWGVPLHAADPHLVPGARRLVDGQRLSADGVELVAHHLPGHTSDHVCLQGADGVVLSGDLVLGSGTSVIAWPDGDLDEYLRSLARLRALRPMALYPGHGDVVDDPLTRIDDLVAHRGQRTAQVLQALADGRETVDAIVAAVYPPLSPTLRAAAARSVTAHLVSLERRGRVARAGERWHGE